MHARNFITAALLVFCLCCALPAQAQCSRATMIGNWTYSATGWSIPNGATTPVQVAFIGVLVVDYSGKTTGPGTFIAGGPFPGTPIVAGQVLEYTIVDGSAQVNSDCTGLFTYTMQVVGFPVTVGPVVERIIVLPDKGEMLSMSIQSPLGKPMWAYTATRTSLVPVPVDWPAAPAAAGFK